MPRLLRFILLLAFISLLLLLVARLLGGTRPALQLSTVMSGPDGIVCDHPCLFGIRPGETSFEQAKLILDTHPLTHNGKWLNNVMLQLPGPKAYIEFSFTRDKLVDSITFFDNLDDSGVPVPDSLVDSILIGEFISAFGAPNVLLPGSPTFVMGFPTAGIIAVSSRPYDNQTLVKPDTPISVLMIYIVRPCPKSATAFLVQPWMGFTPMHLYMNDRRTYKYSHRVSGVSIPPYAQCQA